MKRLFIISDLLLKTHRTGYIVSRGSKSRVLLLFILMFVSQVTLKASGTRSGDSLLNGLWIESKVLYGSVLPHNSSIAYLQQRNVLGFDVDILTGSKNRHGWERLYRNPRYGLGYVYQNLGNSDELGSVHAVYGLIDIPFHQQHGRWRFAYQVDLGLSYFTKRYDAYDNPLNFIVSSPVNVYIGFDLSGSVQLKNQNEIVAALELSHCSNGKIKSPNKGINLVSLSAAYNFNLKPYKPKMPVGEVSDYRRHYFELIINGGGKRDEEYNEKLYGIGSVVVDYYYAYSPRYSFGIGADGFYDPTLSVHKKLYTGKAGGASTNRQLGCHAGFRVRYGDMYVLLNVGHYLVYDYIMYSPVYSRLGIRYALSDQIYLNLTLKAHKAIADFVEWGVGYRFNTRGR